MSETRRQPSGGGGETDVEASVVAVNHAVAVAMRDGPQAGLTLLAGLGTERRLRTHHPFHAARGELLRRAGRAAEAAAAFRRAHDLAGTEPERARLRRQLAALPAAPGDG